MPGFYGPRARPSIHTPRGVHTRLQPHATTRGNKRNVSFINQISKYRADPINLSSGAMRNRTVCLNNLVKGDRGSIMSVCLPAVFSASSTRAVGDAVPILAEWWASVEDAGPAFSQYLHVVRGARKRTIYTIRFLKVQQKSIYIEHFTQHF